MTRLRSTLSRGKARSRDPFPVEARTKVPLFRRPSSDPRVEKAPVGSIDRHGEAGGDGRRWAAMGGDGISEEGKGQRGGKRTTRRKRKGLKGREN